MNQAEIIQQRLINQQIACSTFKNAQDIVGYMAAMQAQEYAMAKWAIGLRLAQSTDAAIDHLFNEGKILRTHLMRPTWHFVAPQDIRWLLQLTAARVHSASAFMYRKSELSPAIFKQCTDIIIRLLQGGKQLQRTVFKEAFEQEGIATDEFRLAYIMMHAELEGVLCSGGREGKQFTYALLEERVPPTPKLTQEEALVALSTRYFASRGPATINDFTVWSGLTVKDAKIGIANLDSRFSKTMIKDKEHFFIPQTSQPLDEEEMCFLMPDYDEYGMAYKDRSTLRDNTIPLDLISRGNPIFNRMLVIDGKIVGSWKRIIKGKKAVIEIYPFQALNDRQQRLLNKAINRYLHFLGERE